MPAYHHNPSDGPLDVLFFFSGGASSMRAALEDPRHGTDYRVVGALTNTPFNMSKKGQDIAFDHGLDFMRLDTHHPTQYPSREYFYKEVLKTIDGEFEKPDVIALSGWLGKYSIVSPPLLESEYPILNVHPAILSIVARTNGRKLIDMGRDGFRQERLDASNDMTHMQKEWKDKNSSPPLGKRLGNGFARAFTGDDPVALAVLMGEAEVGSSIHAVTSVLDGGPVLVRSPRLPVDVERVKKYLARNRVCDVVDYAHALQGEMKVRCDGPAFCEALKLLGQGRLAIGDGFAELDGEMLPYGGYQME